MTQPLDDTRSGFAPATPATRHTWSHGAADFRLVEHASGRWAVETLGLGANLVPLELAAPLPWHRLLAEDGLSAVARELARLAASTAARRTLLALAVMGNADGLAEAVRRFLEDPTSAHARTFLEAHLEAYTALRADYNERPATDAPPSVSATADLTGGLIP
ncbi:MAG: hypothetical protein F9K34_13870 [Albidovulum sp.]|uniref:hypothetical protein n=1 Tax=Albidovulum sp. TaxID=1872424 RepID=UPI00132526D6|nr:hypothetical protein [Defluviimonas sp.]KAB2882677.1 MAG: hypothetical protein F9K34_13870 [Defluviimonas sp.]